MRGSGLLAGQSSMGKKEPTLVEQYGSNRSGFTKIKPETYSTIFRIDLAKILKFLEYQRI